ncbi:MAG: adenine phosphoribosyltransferase [Spirochaetes bacterium]|nr:adenine phosphoribosyltransferase [Spirochaetota bacterium]
MAAADILKSKIRSIPDFPKKGIIFRDITTLIHDREGLRLVVDELVKRYSPMEIDIVAGLEARGFIIGGALAYALGKGFVPLRKAGKLPYKTEQYEYQLEYGTDRVEIHVDAVREGERVLLVDDLLATGGTSIAGARLIEKLGGRVVEIAFIVDLPDVGGRKALREAGYPMFALCEFEGD